MKYEKNQPQPHMNKGEIKIEIDNWEYRGTKRDDHLYKYADFSFLEKNKPKIAGNLLTHYPNGNKFEM